MQYGKIVVSKRTNMHTKFPRPLTKEDIADYKDDLFFAFLKTKDDQKFAGIASEPDLLEDTLTLWFNLVVRVEGNNPCGQWKILLDGGLKKNKTRIIFEHAQRINGGTLLRITNNLGEHLILSRPPSICNATFSMIT